MAIRTNYLTLQKVATGADFIVNLPDDDQKIGRLQICVVSGTVLISGANVPPNVKFLGQTPTPITLLPGQTFTFDLQVDYAPRRITVTENSEVQFIGEA